MARVLLIMPHLPQRMGTPYLGQQYIAASLLHAGHEVLALDMAALRWEGSDEDAAQAAARFAPDVIGMTLFTLNARRGYLLAQILRDRLDPAPLLVAGGPHPTVCPDEPLEHGFDVVVSGEGERAILDVVAAREEVGRLEGRAGIRVRPGRGAPREALEELDGLPFPLLSYPAYEARWYAAEGHVVPGGLMTSRGCPARCTFCANYVTGRAYRWRSAGDVLQEMLALREAWGVQHFPFWDDAFTARRPRLVELCEAILAEPRLEGITWTCITPGNMVRPEELRLMRRAGCVAINFGIESGDYNILKVIQKGQRPEQVRAAVAAAKDAGMTTIVNFMFGFPEEGLEELGNTLAFMESLAPHVDFFNNRGVLVPFPGTAIYDRWHETYGFTRWWLDPAKVPDEPNLHVLTPQVAQDYLERDPTLDLDFFRYAPEVRDAIAACVRFKAQHNARTLQRAAAAFTSTLELEQRAAASVG